MMMMMMKIIVVKAATFSDCLWRTGTDPCTGKSCELCLPTSKSTSRCSCPSYGGKVLKGSQCVGMYTAEADKWSLAPSITIIPPSG